MRRKILSVLLVLCMVLTLLPASVLAAEGDEANTTTVATVGVTPYTSLNDAFNHYYSAAPTTIVLTRDVALSEAITVSGDITLDIGEHNITVSKAIWPANGTAEADKRFAIFTVPTDSKLTIQGSGKITAMENDSYVIAVLGGECVLNDTVEYTGNIEVVEVNTGKLTVNGGTFNLKEKNTTVGNPGEGGDCRFMLNKKDTARDTSTIEVKGGTFCGFDPGNNLAEGENTNFLAEDYESKLTSGTAGTINAVYTVSQKTEPAGATVSITQYEGNDSFWGKTASDMGKFEVDEMDAETKTVKVTGSANYISNYTGFNSDTTEQNGHYLPINIAVTLPDGQSEYGKVTVTGTKPKEMTIDNTGLQLVMFLDNLKDSTFTVKYGDAVYTVDVGGVTLMPNAGTNTTLEPKKDENGAPAGIEAAPKDLAEDDETAVAIPEVEGLKDAEITVSKVDSEAKNAVEIPENAANVPDGFGEILTGENSTIVAVTVKNRNTNEDMFSGDNTLENKSITVTIGGLKAGSTYYVFCITSDAVIFCGPKTLSSEVSISIKTNHLSYWTAVEKTDENAIALDKAAKALTIEDAPEVEGADSTSSELSVSPVKAGLFGTQIKITGLDTSKYYVCQLTKSVKGVESSVALKLHGNEEEVRDVLPGTYKVEIWAASTDADTLTSYGNSIYSDTVEVKG